MEIQQLTILFCIFLLPLIFCENITLSTTGENITFTTTPTAKLQEGCVLNISEVCDAIESDIRHLLPGLEPNIQGCNCIKGKPVCDFLNSTGQYDFTEICIQMKNSILKDDNIVTSRLPCENWASMKHLYDLTTVCNRNRTHPIIASSSNMVTMESTQMASFVYSVTNTVDEHGSVILPSSSTTQVMTKRCPVVRLQINLLEDITK